MIALGAVSHRTDPSTCLKMYLLPIEFCSMSLKDDLWKLEILHVFQRHSIIWESWLNHHFLRQKVWCSVLSTEAQAVIFKCKKLHKRFLQFKFSVMAPKSPSLCLKHHLNSISLSKQIFPFWSRPVLKGLNTHSGLFGNIFTRQKKFLLMLALWMRHFQLTQTI